jgi:hypothetical protein
VTSAAIARRLEAAGLLGRGAPLGIDVRSLRDHVQVLEPLELDRGVEVGVDAVVRLRCSRDFM